MPREEAAPALQREVLPIRSSQANSGNAHPRKGETNSLPRMQKSWTCKQRNSLDTSPGFRKRGFSYMNCERHEASPKKHTVPLSAVPFTEDNSKQLLFVFFCLVGWVFLNKVL